MARTFDDLLVGSLELFCLAAEAGSFTGAAHRAGVTPAAVSRSVARLEGRLGARLFVRTTRSLRLTPGGRRYYEQTRLALGQLEDAEKELGGEQQDPSGTLRLSMATTYGRYRILPLLPLFRERFPRVNFDIHLGNRNIDLVEEDFDLAVRARPPRDSGLVARPLEDAELVVVASPEYLRRHGEPLHPDDLVAHQCIQFCLPSTGRKVPWCFMEAGTLMEHETDGAYSCREDVLAGNRLALAGAGLYQTYRFVVDQSLRDGRLVPVLQAYGGCSRPFSLLYPAGQYRPLRVRAFVDFLLKHLANG